MLLQKPYNMLSSVGMQKVFLYFLLFFLSTQWKSVGSNVVFNVN